MKPSLLYCVIGLALSLSCDRAPNNPGRTEPVHRKIVFVSDRETRPLRQIYTMDSDGSKQTRISFNSEDFINPVYSPDGIHILATSYTYNGFDEIWLMDADGGNLTNLSNSPGDDNFASYSPDGSRIVFASTRDGNSEIYVMDSDGQNQVRLTDSERIDHSPQFISDGLEIMYCSTQVNPDGNDYPYDIYIMNRDGSDKRCLTEGHSYCIFRYMFGGSAQGKEIMIRQNFKPNFSWDESRIVFTSHDTNSDINQVLMMDADGTNHRLVYGDDLVLNPVLFEPGDRRIDFTSHRAGKTDIYQMKLDGTNQVKLTEGTPGHVWFSEFSPDGSRILFYTDVPAFGYRYEKIWIMKRDGSDQIQVTFGKGNDTYPHYQPLATDTP